MALHSVAIENKPMLSVWSWEGMFTWIAVKKAGPLDSLQ